MGAVGVSTHAEIGRLGRERHLVVRRRHGADPVDGAGGLAPGHELVLQRPQRGIELVPRERVGQEVEHEGGARAVVVQHTERPVEAVPAVSTTVRTPGADVRARRIERSSASASITPVRNSIDER